MGITDSWNIKPNTYISKIRSSETLGPQNLMYRWISNCVFDFKTCIHRVCTLNLIHQYRLCRPGNFPDSWFWIMLIVLSTLESDLQRLSAIKVILELELGRTFSQDRKPVCPYYYSLQNPLARGGF